ARRPDSGDGQGRIRPHRSAEASRRARVELRWADLIRPARSRGPEGPPYVLTTGDSRLSTAHCRLLRCRPDSHEQLAAFTVDEQQHRLAARAAHGAPQLFDRVHRFAIDALDQAARLNP